MNNLGNIFNLIAQNNIDPDKVFNLVEKIKSTDLKDENNLRGIIRETAQIAGKSIDRTKEDILVKKILTEGVNEDLFNLL